MEISTSIEDKMIWSKLVFAT